MTGEIEALVARLRSFHGQWRVWSDPYMAFTTLPEQAADALARLTAELASERQETIAWRSAFQAVTPGGSEFQSPKAVREWADMLKTDVFNAKKSAVLSERRALTAEAALAKAGEVEREVLFFTSYCGGDTKGCTEARPCASCLGMSNVFRVRGPMTYVRQLAPEWLTDVPVMPDAQARKIEKRAVRRMKRAAAAIRARATGESP